MVIALVGHFVHVPLSAWPPHECDSSSCTGLLFKYWATEQRFQVTFSADASEDIALTWAELHGEHPCASGEFARLCAPADDVLLAPAARPERPSELAFREAAWETLARACGLTASACELSPRPLKRPR